MDLTPEMCNLICRTAKGMPLGAPRRRYMADTIQSLGLSQRQARRAFHWGGDTIRKALHERRTGLTCADAFSCRGRKPAEFHLPQLLQDIKAIAADQVQTDPTFATTRLYCRLSAAEVRRQLIDRKGYTDEQLPTIKTITDKLNALGFRLRKVAKCRPQKSEANRCHLRQYQGGA
jgi:transposase